MILAALLVWNSIDQETKQQSEHTLPPFAEEEHGNPNLEAHEISSSEIQSVADTLTKKQAKIILDSVMPEYSDLKELTNQPPGDTKKQYKTKVKKKNNWLDSVESVKTTYQYYNSATREMVETSDKAVIDSILNIQSKTVLQKEKDSL